jgi:nucleotide-binding universal stress UspA family protein
MPERVTFYAVSRREPRQKPQLEGEWLRAPKAGMKHRLHSAQPETDFDYEADPSYPPMVVIGVDGSRTSMRAAAYAAGLARRQGAQLLAVYVGSAWCRDCFTPEISAHVNAAYRAMCEHVRREVTESAEFSGMAVKFLAVNGNPVRELTRIAERVHAVSLVVGASESLSSRFRGSVAGRLIRASRWPVIVVP